MIAPTSVSVAPGTGNDINMVNASNVNSATIQVLFDNGNRNTLPVTIEVTIEDTAVEAKGQVKHTVTKTIEATTMETVERITGVDLSSFNEGTLTLTAIVKDSDGNVSAPQTGSVTKIADAPIVKYSSASRNALTTAEIKDLSSTNTDDTIYYLVKEQGETAPTVDEVIEENETLIAGVTATANITSGVAGKVYVVYLAAQTKTGTKSTEVVAIQVAKSVATAIDQVEDADIVKVDGTEATYEWSYDEETEGLVGYKVILKDKDGKVLVEKTINKGEERRVDFLEDLKAQKDLGEEYTVEIIALADNVDYQNAATAGTITGTVESVLDQNITIGAFSTEDGKIFLNWSTTSTNTTAVDHYLVEVAKYDKTANSKEYTTNVKSYTTTELKYDIAPVVEEMGAGTYKFNVTAVAREDLLRSNKSAYPDMASSSIKYHQGGKVTGLAATVSGQKVTLKGSLLSADLFDGLTTEIKYNLHYRKSGVETNYSSAASDANITLPRDVATSLESGTKYDFILETEVTNGTVVKSFYSDPVSATTELGAILATNATYVEYEATSAIDSTPKLDNGKLTYKDGVLYIKSNNTVKSYSSEKYPEVTKIISILDQMGEDDTISINEKITELTLSAADATETKTYDLTNVPSDADVTLTGNATRVTSVKGNLAEITLVGANEFNLSELTANVVNVSTANAILTANSGTKVNATVNSVTVNKVVLTETTSVGLVTVTSDGFEFAGSDLTTLTVDSSASTKVVNLKFNGATPTTLNITADETNGVKLATNTMKITNLNAINGKVDISDSPFQNLTLGGNDTDSKANKVILVTPKTDSNPINGKELTTTPTLIKWFGYYLIASENDIATLDYVANSKEISFTIQDEKTVSLKENETKLAGGTLEETQIDESPMSENEQFKNNMSKIEVSVDKSTNTYVVNAKVDEMQSYVGGQSDSRKYFALLVDVGVPREQLKSGIYNLENGKELEGSADYTDNPNEVLIWLDLNAFTSAKVGDSKEYVLSFKNKNTDEEYFFTVKIVYVQ